jgi:hypothetical protein
LAPCVEISVRWNVGLADEFVVLAMRADPEPMNATRYRQPESPEIKANSDAVILAVSDSLEMQRRMRRVGFELSVVSTRETLDVSG